jgi:hypothetical protein
MNTSRRQGPDRRRAVELGNIARDCERITSPSSRYDIQAAANKLHQLGLISDADHIQFERYYKECALVDAAKLLVPPGWKTNLHQDHEGKWCCSMTEDDPISRLVQCTETICRAKAITEQHARCYCSSPQGMGHR